MKKLSFNLMLIVCIFLGGCNSNVTLIEKNTIDIQEKAPEISGEERQYNLGIKYLNDGNYNKAG